MNLFDEVKFIYNLDNNMLKKLNEIDEKLKIIKINNKQKRNNLVVKSKVRSIHSSLSIEANSLSLFDVENITKNKKVIGKKDEIQEVKNAIKLYNDIKNYDYKKEEDYNRAKKECAETYLYHQAGNLIVVDVIYNVLKSIFA